MFVIDQPTRHAMQGAVVGDALGFHVEAAPAEKVAVLAELIASQRENLDFSALETFPLTDWQTGETYTSGQISDDSQTMLALMAAYEAYPAEETAAMEAFAGRLSTLFTEKRLVGYGRTTEAALKNLAHVSWRESGCPDRATNGGAMRVAPLGVALRADKARVWEQACLQARVTHAHPVAQMASGLVALAAARAALREDIASFLPSLCNDFIAFSTRQGWEEHLRAFAPLLACLEQPFAAARAEILALDAVANSSSASGLSTWAPSTAVWAIGCFLETPDDYFQTIANSISAGGDTDTAAALAGALTAAHTQPDLERFTQWVHDRVGALEMLQPC